METKVWFIVWTLSKDLQTVTKKYWDKRQAAEAYESDRYDPDYVSIAMYEQTTKEVYPREILDEH